MADDTDRLSGGGDDFVAVNVAELHEERLSFGQRMADGLADVAGSWTFIGGFAAFLMLWILANVVMPTPHEFDPFPFILLNLVLSCLAAIQAPVIMMSQNRQEARDRLRDEQDFEVNLKAEQEVADIQRNLDVLRADLARLAEVNDTQAAMLRQLLAALDSAQRRAEPGDA